MHKCARKGHPRATTLVDPEIADTHAPEAVLSPAEGRTMRSALGALMENEELMPEGAQAATHLHAHSKCHVYHSTQEDPSRTMVTVKGAFQVLIVP